MKRKIVFIIPASISDKKDKKNFIKYKKKYLLVHKINSLLSTNLGPVYVISNSRNIIKISNSTKAKSIFIHDAMSQKKTMLFSICKGLEKIKNEISINNYIAVSPMQNLFLRKDTIIKKCKKIVLRNNVNSLNTYYSSFNQHPCQIIDETNKLIKFDVVKFKNTIFTKTEKTRDLPSVSYASCALRVSKYKYIYKLMKKKFYNKFIVDTNSCIGFEINKKEALEIKKSKDLKYAKYLG